MSEISCYWHPRLATKDQREDLVLGRHCSHRFHIGGPCSLSRLLFVGLGFKLRAIARSRPSDVLNSLTDAGQTSPLVNVEFLLADGKIYSACVERSGQGRCRASICPPNVRAFKKEFERALLAKISSAARIPLSTAPFM